MKQIKISCTDTNGLNHLISVNTNDVDSKPILATIAVGLSSLTRSKVDVVTDVAGVITTFNVTVPLTELTINIMKYFFSDPLIYRKFNIMATNEHATIEAGLSSVLFRHTLRLDNQDVGYSIAAIWDTDACDTTFFKPLDNKDTSIHVFQDASNLYEFLTDLIGECTATYRNARLRDLLKTRDYESIDPAYLELIDKGLDCITTCSFPIKQNTIYSGHDKKYSFDVYTKIFQDYLAHHKDHEIYLFHNKDHFYFIFSTQAKHDLIKQHIDQDYGDKLFFAGFTSYPDSITIPETNTIDPGLELPNTYSWLFSDRADVHGILKDVLLNTILKEPSEVKTDTDIDLSGVTL
nr:MAG TPA: hypothetical protein [Caudoviricetes sp.]